MAPPYRKISGKDVHSGKSELPQELEFLANTPFLQAEERRVSGSRVWVVEISTDELRVILEYSRRLEVVKSKFRAERTKNKVLEQEIADLEFQIKCLEAAPPKDLVFENERLRKKLKATKKPPVAAPPPTKSIPSADLIRTQHELARVQGLLDLERNANAKAREPKTDETSKLFAEKNREIERLTLMLSGPGNLKSPTNGFDIADAKSQGFKSRINKPPKK